MKKYLLIALVGAFLLQGCGMKHARKSCCERAKKECNIKDSAQNSEAKKPYTGGK